MTKEQAIALAESNFWEGMSHREIAEFQMMEEKLCMPFTVFHEAVEKTLGRPVFTHEFGLNYQGIKDDSPVPIFSTPTHTSIHLIGFPSLARRGI